MGGPPPPAIASPALAALGISEITASVVSINAAIGTGADFAAAEPAYRQGFEAAMRSQFRSRAFAEASNDLRDLYPEYFGLKEFQHGYERGRRHRKEPSVT